MIVRYLGLALVLLIVQSAAADPVTLTGYHQQVNIQTSFPPTPRTARFNEFTVDGVLPSLEPQRWEWPLTEMPETVTFGIGAVINTHDDLLIVGPDWIHHPRHVVDFVPHTAALELVYWYWSPVNGAHRIEWSIIGDGRVVPEPGALSMVALSAVAFVARRRRRYLVN